MLAGERERTTRRAGRPTGDLLAWGGATLALLAAAVLLFGPLWHSAVGENPLLRPSGLDLDAILSLALPTVVVMAGLVVALAGRRRIMGAVAVLVMAAGALLAPGSLPLWFAPAVLLVAAGYLLRLRQGRAEAHDTAPPR